MKPFEPQRSHGETFARVQRLIADVQQKAMLAPDAETRRWHEADAEALSLVLQRAERPTMMERLERMAWEAKRCVRCGNEERVRRRAGEDTVCRDSAACTRRVAERQPGEAVQP